MVTINCAAGCWHSNYSKIVHVTDVHLKQVAVKQYMKELHYSETEKVSA